MKYRWLLIIGALVLLVVGLGWLGPKIRSFHGNGTAPGFASTPLGTTGRSTTGSSATAPGDDDDNLSPATIREIETITGAIDPHELIGRRVNLDLRAGETITGNSFWVGPRDNRVLVVLGRDVRNGAQRESGEVATSGVEPVRPGTTVRIAGTVQAIPADESRFSWGMNDEIRTSLDDQTVYIRADTVTPE